MEDDRAPDVRSTEELEAKARKRVKKLKDFYVHIAIYLVVNLFLFGINLATSPDYLWVLWPMAGWGVALVIHAIEVVEIFGIFGLGGKEWEERKVKELVLRDQHALGADEVRQLLRQELNSSKQVSLERIVQRLENLEAIVTSQEWDMLEQSRKKEEPLDQSEAEKPHQEAARLARRVR